MKNHSLEDKVCSEVWVLSYLKIGTAKINTKIPTEIEESVSKKVGAVVHRHFRKEIRNSVWREI